MREHAEGALQWLEGESKEKKLVVKLEGRYQHMYVQFLTTVCLNQIISWTISIYIYKHCLVRFAELLLSLTNACAHRNKNI